MREVQAPSYSKKRSRDPGLVTQNPCGSLDTSCGFVTQHLLNLIPGACSCLFLAWLILPALLDLSGMCSLNSQWGPPGNSSLLAFTILKRTEMGWWLLSLPLSYNHVPWIIWPRAQCLTRTSQSVDTGTEMRESSCLCAQGTSHVNTHTCSEHIFQTQGGVSVVKGAPVTLLVPGSDMFFCLGVL